MRAYPFKSVLLWVARRMLGSAELMQAADAAAYVDAINEATRDCWERDAWQEWCPIEERHWGPTWDTGSVYNLGDIVWMPESAAYFRSLFNSQTGNSPGNSNYWEQMGVPADGLPCPDDCGCDCNCTSGGFPTTPDRPPQVIALDQPGQLPIGIAYEVTVYDPRMFPGANRLKFTVDEGGIRVQPRALNARRDFGGCAYNSVWLHYRRRPPQFTSELWSSATAYKTGDLVYHDPTGECWQALAGNTNIIPGTNPIYWAQVVMPYVLSEAVKHFAYALALADDGEQDKQAAEEARAENFLTVEWQKQESQQGQVRQVQVLVRR